MNIYEQQETLYRRNDQGGSRATAYRAARRGGRWYICGINRRTNTERWTEIDRDTYTRRRPHATRNSELQSASRPSLRDPQQRRGTVYENSLIRLGSFLSLFCQNSSQLSVNYREVYRGRSIPVPSQDVLRHGTTSRVFVYEVQELSRNDKQQLMNRIFQPLSDMADTQASLGNRRDAHSYMAGLLRSFGDVMERGNLQDSCILLCMDDVTGLLAGAAFFTTPMQRSTHLEILVSNPASLSHRAGAPMHAGRNTLDGVHQVACTRGNGRIVLDDDVPAGAVSFYIRRGFSLTIDGNLACSKEDYT